MTESGGGNADTQVEDDGNVAVSPPPASPMRRRKSVRRRLFYSFVRLAVFLVVVVGAAYFAIERGTFDDVLKREARAILTSVVEGGGYEADIEKATLRFDSRGRLAFDVRNAVLRPTGGKGEAFSTREILISLEPFPLLAGRIAVSSIDIDGAGIDLDALKAEEQPQGQFRVDSIPQRLTSMFAGLDMVDMVARRVGARDLTLSGLHFNLNGLQNRKVPVHVGAISFQRSDEGALEVTGDMTVEGVPATFTARAGSGTKGVADFAVAIDNFNLRPFSSLRTRQDKPFIGLDGVAALTFSAARGGGGTPADMRFGMKLSNSAFYGEGQPSQITAGEIQGHYDFKADKIEIDPSRLTFSDTNLPFTGGFIDAEHLSGGAEQKAGMAIDLVIQGGQAAPANLGDRPVDFNAKAFGTLDQNAGLLSIPDILIASRAGVLGGSVSVKFHVPPGEGMPGDSPEISLGLFTEKIESNAIRALWPFWLGPQARNWVYENLFGGEITNGSLAVFMPAGRLPHYPEDPIVLNEKELKIRFDIARARISIAGDIPPIRDTIAHFEMTGPHIETQIKSATAYFPSGRTVDLSDGKLVMADVSRQPLIAAADFKLAGHADALAELASYRPIDALKMTGFKPEDFTGDASVALKIRFPLENDPTLKPNWVANLDLANVAIKPPVGGKAIANVNGRMSLNPLSAALEADVTADGAPLHISLVEPLSADSRQKRRKHVTATVSANDLARLTPGIEDIISGTVGIEMELLDGNRQSVDVDLTRAKVSIPWAGWEKGVGIGAAAKFVAEQDGDKYKVSNFTFSGDGFGVSGSLEADKSGLASANFTKVKLSPTDDLAMTVTRTGNAYRISATGKSADIRGLLNTLKAPGSDDNPSGGDVSVNAKIGVVTGFNNEILKNVDAAYAVKKGRPVTVKLTAVTGNDQALVAKLSADDGGRRSIDLTATDAGAFTRFVGIYDKMIGGLLNFKIRYVSEGQWRGVADIRNFRVVNEEKLQKIVSTPAGDTGKSLNDAVKRNIDVSSQRFSRGYARILIDGDVTSIENGVVRGEQVGATFQGVLRDGKGAMNLTGTFMPAYGLNRLFAELPIIGLLLGNGRDRGLIGITFRLSGPYDQPQLQVNPLSLIAPGVFRNIFEFR